MTDTPETTLRIATSTFTPAVPLVLPAELEAHGLVLARAGAGAGGFGPAGEAAFDAVQSADYIVDLAGRITAARAVARAVAATSESRKKEWKDRMIAVSEAILAEDNPPTKNLVTIDEPNPFVCANCIHRIWFAGREHFLCAHHKTSEAHGGDGEEIVAAIESMGVEFVFTHPHAAHGWPGAVGPGDVSVCGSHQAGSRPEPTNPFRRSLKEPPYEKID